MYDIKNRGIQASDHGLPVLYTYCCLQTYEPWSWNPAFDIHRFQAALLSNVHHDPHTSVLCLPPFTSDKQRYVPGVMDALREPVSIMTDLWRAAEQVQGSHPEFLLALTGGLGSSQYIYEFRNKEVLWTTEEHRLWVKKKSVIDARIFFSPERNHVE